METIGSGNSVLDLASRAEGGFLKTRKYHSTAAAPEQLLDTSNLSRHCSENQFARG